MKIKKIKLQDEYIYPATITAAIKDANFLKEDGTAMTQEEINAYLKSNSGSGASETSNVYGVRHYYNDSSTVLTRIGASNLHATLPVQSLMRRCILADDGTVAYYLDANDSTKKEDGTAAVLDGTDGQIMVEIPTHYRKHTLGSDYYDSEISLDPFVGAFKINKYYVSMSEATMDRTNNKLSSVVNTTTQYRGGNNTSSWDSTYRSQLGLPATSISSADFHTYANNRGTGWEMYEADVHDDIYWLYVIEYANTNVQLAYNSALTSEGYHQGGLGDGVVGVDSSTWSTYNSSNPVIPCNATLSLGNNSGVVSYSPLSSDGSTAWATFNVPSYRGIQNLYAHIWEWVIGYIGVGNGSNQIAYRCRNRNQYSTDSLNSYYSQVGLLSTEGWIQTIIKNEQGDIIPDSVSASESTYFSDYLQEYHVNGTIYCTRLGGRLDNGTKAGLGAWLASDPFTYTSTKNGSRLVYCNSESIIGDKVQKVTNNTSSSSTIDDTLSDTSENAVQNKVITNKINSIIAELKTLEAYHVTDLSMIDIYGKALSSQSTANCYVVKEAGNYKLPLVYGNAIKNGSANTAAYTNLGTSTYMMDFVNAYGNQITSPYIETDTGKTCAEAQFSIGDADIFKDLSIFDGYLYFTVSDIPVTGANGVLSVKDSEGNIMWNWHIWVFPYDLTPVTITNSTSVDYNIMPVYLATTYDDGDETKRKNWHYQWGRSVPILGPGAYNSNTNATSYGALSFTITANSSGAYQQGILNPATFWTTSSSSWFGTTSYYNLWDANWSTTGCSDNTTVKTVYDPSPVGFKIPNGNTFTYFSTSNVVGSFANGWKFKKNSSDTAGIFFPASGFKSPSTGSQSGVGSLGYVWLSAAYSQRYVYQMYLSSSTVYPHNSTPQAAGRSVCCVAEL